MTATARHDAIGIKQVIRLEWMEKAAGLLLAGLEPKAIRHELHEFLAERKGSGETGERSDKTRTFAVNNLMRTWIEPERDLMPFRDDVIQHLAADTETNLPIHWAMISAAYPFWFNVARQTGRLLNLQSTVTQQQVCNRLKEQYGDRPTITRYTRFVIRSFVAWNILTEANPRGRYQKTGPRDLSDKTLSDVIEAALHTTPKPKTDLEALLHDPGFFPFKVHATVGTLQRFFSPRVEVEAIGFGERYAWVRGKP